jgi:large subunit ribosomal protein L9
MRVLLLKDVFKLGRAGDVKKVADGYGRNYLLPRGLAVLATPATLKQADRIRQQASEERERLNVEFSAVAERLQGLRLIFPAKASETGRLYGSITPAMIIEAIEKQSGVVVEKRQLDNQPIKTLGVHNLEVRLTIDLAAEISVLVHREGEPPESAEEFVAPSEEQTEAETVLEMLEATEDEAPADADDEEVQADEQGEEAGED